VHPMRKPLLVAQREIKETLKTKGFWIGVLLFPVIFTAMSVGPTYLERKKSVRTYVVRDSSGWLSREVEREGAVADTRRLLLEAQRRQLQSKDVDQLPPGLRELAPIAAKMTPSQLDSSARAGARRHHAARAAHRREPRGGHRRAGRVQELVGHRRRVDDPRRLEWSGTRQVRARQRNG